MDTIAEKIVGTYPDLALRLFVVGDDLDKILSEIEEEGGELDSGEEELLREVVETGWNFSQDAEDGMLWRVVFQDGSVLTIEEDTDGSARELRVE